MVVASWAACLNLLARRPVRTCPLSLEMVAGRHLKQNKPCNCYSSVTAELIQLLSKKKNWYSFHIEKHKRSVLKVKIFFAKFDRCCSNLWFNKQYQRCLLGQGFGTMGITQWFSPVATENTCTECVQRSHPKNGLREKWCFHAHLNSHGKGKAVNTWDIYIYTMEMWSDAWTMVQLRKNNVLLTTFFLSFQEK